MRYLMLWATVSALLYSASSLAAPYYSFHPTSFEDHGVCPLECCRYQDWTVNKTTPIRNAHNPKAPVLFTAKKDDQVKALTGVVITSEAGKAKLLKPLILNGEQLDKGDIVHLLTPLGKDTYKIWYRGKRVRDFNHMSDLEIVIRPKWVWWIKVQNEKGQIGWSDQSANFDNKGVCPSS